jgi:hypothetical protein
MRTLGCANGVKEEFLRDLVANIWVGCESVVLDQYAQIREAHSRESKFLLNGLRNHVCRSS